MTKLIRYITSFRFIQIPLHYGIMGYEQDGFIDFDEWSEVMTHYKAIVALEDGVELTNLHQYEKVSSALGSQLYLRTHKEIINVLVDNTFLQFHWDNETNAYRDEYNMIL